MLETLEELEELYSQPKLTTADARLLLWQRCRDAGWSIGRTTKYLNRMIPIFNSPTSFGT